MGPREREMKCRLLGNLERVIQFSARVPNRALNLGVAKEQRDGSKILGAPVDLPCLSASQRMRTGGLRVVPDIGYPILQQLGVLPG